MTDQRTTRPDISPFLEPESPSIHELYVVKKTSWGSQIAKCSVGYYTGASGIDAGTNLFRLHYFSRKNSHVTYLLALFVFSRKKNEIDTPEETKLQMIERDAFNRKKALLIYGFRKSNCKLLSINLFFR